MIQAAACMHCTSSLVPPPWDRSSTTLPSPGGRWSCIGGRPGGPTSCGSSPSMRTCTVGRNVCSLSWSGTDPPPTRHCSHSTPPSPLHSCFAGVPDLSFPARASLHASTQHDSSIMKNVPIALAVVMLFYVRGANVCWLTCAFEQLSVWNSSLFIIRCVFFLRLISSACVLLTPCLSSVALCFSLSPEASWAFIITGLLSFHL